MSPLRYDSEYKSVSISSKWSTLGHYKGDNLFYDVSCVHKLKIKMYIMLPVIVLSI